MKLKYHNSRINLLIVFFLIIFNANQIYLFFNESENKHTSNLTTWPDLGYTSHTPINIDGNTDFINQATAESWTGDGTSSNPFIIEGYSITSTGSYMLSIKNTDLYFIVCNSMLDGTSESGIYFENVQNGIISKNTIKNCRHNGINIINSNNILLLSNHISYCGPGLYDEGVGILVSSSSSITIEANNIEYNKVGIYFASTYGSSILLNRIWHSLFDGIKIVGVSYSNIITSNTISYSGLQGVLVDNGCPMYQWTYIYYNTITNCIEYGIQIDNGDFIQVKFNNFINNYIYDDDQQAWGDGYYISFDSNYWSDFDSSYQYWPDKYYVLYYGYDNNPQTTVYSISTPTITSPNGGEMYSHSNITIQWASSTDSHGYPITYDVYFTSNDGASWKSLASGLTGTSYELNSAILEDTSNARIKIKAISSQVKGISQDVTDSMFIVHNNLPTPTISYPNGGETIEKTISIQWAPSLDLHGHLVEYEVFYSDDDGQSWVSLISGLTSYSYDWDTTTVPNGNNYRIKVNATCSTGATKIDISDAKFTILNHYLLAPDIIYPNGGEILSGIKRLQWSAAIDTHGHDVFYSLYYSIDNGFTWIPFAASLLETYYDCDTTTLIEGSTYLLRVVASCSGMLYAEDISDGFFTVHNDISVPTVLFPNGGEILQGEVIIQWTEVIDSMGHSIDYNLMCSLDGGNNWNLIISDLTSTSYNWNTLTVPDSNNALIKVTANCSEGAVSEDISDNPFTIRNHILIPPILTSPNGGEVIHGIHYISWTSASDSLGHPIVYDLYYSNNSGTDWTLLIDNLDALSWEWDTRLVLDGGNYLVKIVAKCSHELFGEDTSNSVFEIKNHFFTTDLVIFTPSDNEIITGNYQISWSNVVDYLGHSITYDVYYSDDGGQNWNALISDITNYHYYWATWEYEDGPNYFVKVVAKCTEGLTTETVKGPLILDNTNPSGSIIINEGAEYTNTTNVVLTIEGYDVNGVIEMRFSNDGVSWTSWESYSISKTYSLQIGDDEKTVYVQFKDGADLISDPTVINDSIILDTIRPFGTIQINNDETFTTSTSVTLTIYGYDENGITAMRFGYDGVSWTSWEPFNISKIFTLPNGDDEKTVYIQFEDVVGLISNDVISDSIILDTTTPTGSILINNGDENTSTTYIALTIDSHDANGVIEMRFSLDNIVWTEWEPYSSFQSIEAEDMNGVITVYIQLKDAAGLISDNIIFDEIILKTNETEDKNISGPTMIIVGLFTIIGVISLICLKKRDVIFKS